MRHPCRKEGTQRTVRQFAWFPVSDGDEWRWLEWVMIRQRWIAGYGDGDGFWVTECFVD